MSVNVVLIHGAWQGGWVWDGIVPRLESAGFAPQAVDLPGSAASVENRAAVTLAGQVNYLEDLVSRLMGPVFVVAHSGGGLAASELAERTPTRIAGIVYVAGMMLPDGMTFARLAEACRADDPSASGIWPHLEHLDGLTRVPVAAAVGVFFHDADPAAARAAAARLTPQSNAARDVAPHITAARFGTVPRIYIEALRDRSVVPSVQRRMQALVPGAARRSIDTGHAPMLADPEGLAALLLEALVELGASGAS